MAFVTFSSAPRRRWRRGFRGPYPNADAALWHNSGDDKLRFRNARGGTFDLEPAQPLIEHRFTIAAGPTANIEFVLGERQEIVDVVVHKIGRGGGEGSVRLANGATGAAITDALSIDVDGGRVIRPSSIDPDAKLIEAGTPLRFVRTRVSSTDESMIVYVTALRRPR